MRNIILLISVVITLSSCQPKCQDDPNMSADELAWFNCFVGGRTLIFKSNTGLYDTAKPGNISLSLSTCSNQDDCSHANTFAQLNFGFSHHIYGDKPNHFIVTHYNQYCPNGYEPITLYINSSYGLKLSNYTPQNNITINGKTYNNVYIMATDTIPFTPLNPCTIWRFYYTKNDGILEYDWSQGVQWVKIN